MCWPRRSNGCWRTIAPSRCRRFRVPVAALAKLDEIVPDRGQFPQASGLLDPRDPLKEELRLFIDSVLRSDRSVRRALTADYTFLNERLAMHYGIENVKGARFRRVTLPDESRYGLLGKGADPDVDGVSQPHVARAAGRVGTGTPLGAPPPEPPALVPTLAENKRGETPRTLRERLEQHRENPTCFMCHGVMDPIGFALENFSAVGQSRAHDPDTLTPIDASGVLPDGTSNTGGGGGARLVGIARTGHRRCGMDCTCGATRSRPTASRAWSFPGEQEETWSWTTRPAPGTTTASTVSSPT